MDNYEEKYNMVLEKTKEFYALCKKCGAKDTVNFLENIFPELKGSENERIRKDLIEWFEEFPDMVWRGHYKKDVLAWLEKQGEHNNIKLIEEIKRNRKLLLSEKKKELSQSEKLSLGARIAMLDELLVFEQQSEQTHSERQSEVTKTSGQELELKFKVGDWIIDNEYGEVLKVTKADANSYEITTQDGEAFEFLKEDVECNHRLWTIADAKDGDALVSNGKRGQEVGIVKEFIGKYGGHDKCFETYCYSDLDGIFRIGEYMGGTSIHPATKEQRDLLFQKMADEGYKWDADKKELLHKQS